MRWSRPRTPRPLCATRLCGALRAVGSGPVGFHERGGYGCVATVCRRCGAVSCPQLSGGRWGESKGKGPRVAGPFVAMSQPPPELLGRLASALEYCTYMKWRYMGATVSAFPLPSCRRRRPRCAESAPSPLTRAQGNVASGFWMSFHMHIESAIQGWILLRYRFANRVFHFQKTFSSSGGHAPRKTLKI